MKKLGVDLWFDKNAEEAVDFYMSVFADAKVLGTTYYPKEAPGPEGSVMYIQFELEGQTYGAINGGPHFTFSPAISMTVTVDTQDELDDVWGKLSAVPKDEQCGWLTDKFGLSWQIVPTRLNELISDPDRERASRAVKAMLQMKKLDIAALEAAADG